jgi:hypothetical protein
MSPEHRRKIHRRKIRHRIYLVVGIILLLLIALAAAFGMSALKAKGSIEQAVSAASGIESSIMAGDTDTATKQMDTLATNIDAAYGQTNGILWEMASKVPYYGTDVSAIRTAVTAMENVSSQAMPELKQAMDGLSLKNISISDGTVSIPGLTDSAPHLVKANSVIAQANSELSNIPQSHISLINTALGKAQQSFGTFTNTVKNATLLAQVAPKMLNLDGGAPRTYLILSQTNSELRPTGGVPGSWGTVTVDKGKLSIQPFVSESELPWLDKPAVEVTSDETELFTDKLARMPQDVNFTPDFPRTGEIAKAMWNSKYQQQVDGVIAIDPVFLQNMLAVAGSATMPDGTVLDGSNTASTLLNQVYFDKPVSEQDEFFSTAAQTAFDRITQNSGDPSGFLKAMTTSIENGHLLMWNAHEDEQKLLADSTIAGVLETQASKPQIGVYFSDQTQSKMDWYLKREVSAKFQKVAANGARQYEVHIKLTNTMDPAQVGSIPQYITGDLIDGMQAGQINTVTYLYAPAGGRLVDWKLSDNGEFDAITTHDGLTLGMKKSVLGPGQSLDIVAHVQSSPGVDTEAVLRQTPQIPGRTE